MVSFNTAEVDLVEISFEDVVLGIVLFELHCTEDLSHLSVPCLLVIVCNVLDELLCDGRTTEFSTVYTDLIECKVQNSGTCSLEVNTFVCVETFVLDTYESKLYMIRKCAYVTRKLYIV